MNVLIIDGKRFDHVRGVKKFYLIVPTLNAVLFVVNERDYSVGYHIFKMETGEDIRIKASSSLFGGSIGMPNSSDIILEAANDKIVLCNSGQDRDGVRKSLTYLDLGKKAVVAEKTIFYDTNGQVIREHDKLPPF